MIKNRVHISKPALVYNDEELGFTLDGSCCTMRRDDGANWDEHIVAATAEPYTGLFYYSTIVGLDDEASDDFSTVGHDFYIYYTHKVNFLRLPDNYGDYFTDMYYRCRVTIK